MNENQTYLCADISAHLDDYLDQEIALSEMPRILQHLESCADCQARCQQEYQKLAQLRAHIQQLSLPDALLARLLRALSMPPPPADGSDTQRNVRSNEENKSG